MKKKRRRVEPELVVKNGKPTAVILDIDEYRDLLEKLEDREDLEFLEEMSKRKLEFTTLDEFLEEYNPDV